MMRIAFYAPLKSPDHPVPSGDRLMARQLRAALERKGHKVEIASQLRAFHATPDRRLPDLEAQAAAEHDRLATLWSAQGPPDLWFAYHPYYKAPDLIGPRLCRLFDIPYVTAEASYSQRRNIGVWTEQQGLLLDIVADAAVNICLTERDRAGLAAAVPGARLARIVPFIDPGRFAALQPAPEPGRLVTVAMMREGDKIASYEALAAALHALSTLAERPWRLSIAGDGPARSAVEQIFAPFGDRIEWHGECSPDAIAGLLARACLYVWPGHGEAYGLAYLEAQAAGLPVVAEHVAGVPEVVEDGRTGLLVAPGDPKALAAAILRLLDDEAERGRLGAAARQFVLEERSLDAIAGTLSDILEPVRSKRR